MFTSFTKFLGGSSTSVTPRFRITPVIFKFWDASAAPFGAPRRPCGRRPAHPCGRGARPPGRGSSKRAPRQIEVHTSGRVCTENPRTRDPGARFHTRRRPSAPACGPVPAAAPRRSGIITGGLSAHVRWNRAEARLPHSRMQTWASALCRRPSRAKTRDETAPTTSGAASPAAFADQVTSPRSPTTASLRSSATAAGLLKGAPAATAPEAPAAASTATRAQRR